MLYVRREVGGISYDPATREDIVKAVREIVLRDMGNDDDFVKVNLSECSEYSSSNDESELYSNNLKAITDLIRSDVENKNAALDAFRLKSGVELLEEQVVSRLAHAIVLGEQHFTLHITSDILHLFLEKGLDKKLGLKTIASTETPNEWTFSIGTVV